MPYIMIAFGPSEDESFDPDKIEPSIDQILTRDIREREPQQSEKQQLRPMNQKCHVMNRTWVIHVTSLSPDEIVKELEEIVPPLQSFVVVPIDGDWLARNGAMTAGKCFSW